MKKHTPGPWMVKESGEANVCTIMRTDQRNWLAVVRQNGELSVATEAANAELMASAPDLLAERDRLKSVNADLRETLRGLTALCLEMGHTIRSLDESGDHHEEWTNDGEYIPDDRFSAASAALSNTLDYSNSPTLLGALKEESSVSLHTPGPWFFDVSTGEVESGFGLIAHVVGYDNPDDETIPNGHLLAEAPALKEKNEELLACVLDVLNADGNLDSMDFNRYRAAVDKAEAGRKASWPSPGGC